MMRPLYALVATFGLVFLAAPISALTTDALSEPTRCVGTACDRLNDVCVDCIPASEDAGRCAPEPCGTINSVCWKAFHVNCVRSADTAMASSEVRCMGPVCEAINAVCYIALKQWCVG